MSETESRSTAKSVSIEQIGKPVNVIDLFPQERSQLIDLLSSLSDIDWGKPTSCPRWSVKDLTDHLLGDDVGVISRLRDNYKPSSQKDSTSLVDLVNRRNAEWVNATKRISPKLLIELLKNTGEETYNLFRVQDPNKSSGGVSWAGVKQSPNWFNSAREYTERWSHQEQIREALGASPLIQHKWLNPVLETYVKALPFTYRNTAAASGTSVRLMVDGEAGGNWGLSKTSDLWVLGEVSTVPTAQVKMDQDTAWKLFTKGLTKEEAIQRTNITGDHELGLVLLNTVSIIA